MIGGAFRAWPWSMFRGVHVIFSRFIIITLTTLVFKCGISSKSFNHVNLPKGRVIVYFIFFIVLSCDSCGKVLKMKMHYIVFSKYVISNQSCSFEFMVILCIMLTNYNDSDKKYFI